jgi:hypothetical protein
MNTAFLTAPSPISFAELAHQVDHFSTTVEPTAAPVALDGTIYQTTNYDLFHLLPENRVVDLVHVRKLVAMITQSNLLHVKPLDVTADLGIIDGQHRLAAARELGLPVYYKISQQLSEADITTLNVAQKNWQGPDYLHYWSVKGRTDYLALTKFWQRHPSLSFSNAKMMLGGSSNNRAQEFRAGSWKASDEAYKGELAAVLVERVAAETPFKQAMHTGFVAAVYHCVANVEDFNSKVFLEKILKQPRTLVPCASHKQYLAMFDEIYNYQTRVENRVRFI